MITMITVAAVITGTTISMITMITVATMITGTAVSRLQ